MLPCNKLSRHFLLKKQHQKLWELILKVSANFSSGVRSNFCAHSQHKFHLIICKTLMKMIGWLHDGKKLLKLELKTRNECEWGGKSRTEQTEEVDHAYCVHFWCCRCLLNTSRNSCISWQWANFKVSFILKSLQRFSSYPKPIWTLLVWKPGYRSFQDLAYSGLCSYFHFFSQTSLTTGTAIFMVFWCFISCQAWDQEVQRRLKIKN